MLVEAGAVLAETVVLVAPAKPGAVMDPRAQLHLAVMLQQILEVVEVVVELCLL
jgi:hypothetical protein